ncbi:hypothetical protein [Bifidobacterium callitrichidarum]|uniref:Uncharacterized protein n=1 Tax=Bifidobacterium callitrichidarum TaxID=2052941 RepID=A0A2U2NAN2_9BIFI|nr:hypothetical protein [Bifidobacterium callitrichidarum]PWG66172.1 hypothetical protein DF196_05005 [Bifidobacterium callitrichidarum]
MNEQTDRNTATDSGTRDNGGIRAVGATADAVNRAADRGDFDRMESRIMQAMTARMAAAAITDEPEFGARSAVGMSNVIIANMSHAGNDNSGTARDVHVLHAADPNNGPANTTTSEAVNAAITSALAASPLRREQAIAAAVRAGVPKRVTLWSTLREARGSLRLRDLFFGAWDCVAVALVMTVAVWLIPFLRILSDGVRVFTDPGTLYASMFLAAPFLYEATHLLVRWREHEQRTDELLRTMRWSFVRLCALRMLVVGAVAATLIVAYGLCVNEVGMQMGFVGSGSVTNGTTGAASAPGATGFVMTTNAPVSRFSLVTLLGVAFSALFLFGIAQLAADVRCRWPWSMIVVPAAWVALGVVLLTWHDSLSPLLTGLPPMVALVTAVATGIAYFAAMNRFVRRSPAVARFA